MIELSLSDNETLCRVNMDLLPSAPTIASRQILNKHRACELDMLNCDMLKTDIMTNPFITHIIDYELSLAKTSTTSSYYNKHLNLLPASVFVLSSIYLKHYVCMYLF